MNDPAASSGVSTKDTINFIVASDGVLDPRLRNKILPANLPVSINRDETIVDTARHLEESPAAIYGNENDSDLDGRIKTFERRIIVDALRQSAGVQVKAAAILGIKERSLWHRIKKHQIDIAEFKP